MKNRPLTILLSALPWMLLGMLFALSAVNKKEKLKKPSLIKRIKSKSAKIENLLSEK